MKQSSKGLKLASVAPLRPVRNGSAPATRSPTARPADFIRVDGRRLTIEGADEIELVCGKASIILRRNGRIIIRGAQVETSAQGLNRIKGGSVKIN
jgi:hypothetical protein